MEFTVQPRNWQLKVTRSDLTFNCFGIFVFDFLLFELALLMIGIGAGLGSIGAALCFKCVILKEVTQRLLIDRV